MSLSSRRGNTNATPPTWEQYKAAVRKIDRDSLLIEAAAATAAIARSELPEESARLGLNPWNIADVARTSLAWGSFHRPKAHGRTLLELCNINVHLGDEALVANPEVGDVFGQVLARLFFEQFPGQRSILAEVARTILLFGSAAEHPPDFSPEVMKPGWFQSITGGLTLDEYVESVFLISVGAQQSNGAFSLDWLDGPAFREIEDVISFDAVRKTFSEHLLTTVPEFKRANRDFQGLLPSSQKKFAFNFLADKPFVAGVADTPIAPWVQAVISKALPPAVYHLGRRALDDGFTRDLGHVFQHYSGRQIALINGDRQVIPEARYGSRRSLKDSCDWFIELPGLTVLIECKARQPIESLRTGGEDWIQSVRDSIGKGISQLNRSNADIVDISTACPQIDATKRRVGLIVTLEPFYLNQNWLVRSQLPKADFPVGVLSIGELESLVLLHADELAWELCHAADSSLENVMLLAQALNAADGRANPLLNSTWEAIGLFERVSSTSDRLGTERSDEV